MALSCVVPHDGAALDEAAIRVFPKARLASFEGPRAAPFFSPSTSSR